MPSLVLVPVVSFGIHNGLKVTGCIFEEHRQALVGAAGKLDRFQLDSFLKRKQAFSC